MPSILFASHHFLFEQSGGAEVCAQHFLHLLGKRGWRCEAFCGAVRAREDLPLGKLLAERGLTARTVELQSGPAKFKVHRVDAEGMPGLVYEPETMTRPPAPREGYPFLQLLDQLLTERRPDVMLTFGGNWLSRAAMMVARRHGVPVVFWLRHLRYQHADLFDSCSAMIVPSEFSARFYKEKFGIDCDVVPAPIRMDRAFCPNRRPKCATFVAPNPNKGAFYFARIATELARLRPDIPMLVAVGRGDLSWLDKTGLNLRKLPNLKVMPPTPDARNFWSVTRVHLAPALWNETFMRTGAEAMFNGIPVLASRRGAIPATLGESGFLFDIPERYTPEASLVPSAEEVEPWVRTVIRLWDDEAFYREQSGRSLAESRRFHPDVVIPAHEKVLERAMRRARKRPDPLPPLANDLAGLQKWFEKPMQLEKFVPAEPLARHPIFAPR